MAGVEDEYSVEEFSSATANSALHDRVCAGYYKTSGVFVSSSGLLGPLEVGDVL